MPGGGEAPRLTAREVEVIAAAPEPESPAPITYLMEAICDPENIEAALRVPLQCFGGVKKDRLFLCASTSVYALYGNGRGATEP